MQAARLNITDFPSSNQASAKTEIKQDSHFGELLLRQTEPFPSLKDKVQPQQGKEQQLAEMYENLEEILPDEVMAILKENEFLQEEVAAIIMQEAASQQEARSTEDDEQQLLLEKLLNRHLSSKNQVNQIDVTTDAKADEKAAADIYNEMINLLKDIEKTADIDDVAGKLANLLQDWEAFFQKNPDLDKENMLDKIQQQIQSADSSPFDQTIHQMACSLLAGDLSKRGEHLDNLDADSVLQDLQQVISELDPAEAKHIMEQITKQLTESGLLDEELLESMAFNEGQADSLKANIQQVLDVINRQIQTAEPSVAEQVMKQIAKLLQAYRQPEQAENQVKQAMEQSASAMMSSRQASAGDIEGMQRLEARIATWLQSAFKEVSPGVIKQNGHMNGTSQTDTNNEAEYRQPVKEDMVHRTEAKLAAWLQTSFQGTSSAGLKQESLPISKVEQFIIHMGQSDTAKGLSGKELIEKMETIVQSQRLQGFARGQNPIAIQLRPENLGDMTIRFVQTNGELTVQMLVSSKAVKEVLESNLHQLRNMFSPHQVSVERQDNLAASQTDASKSSKENQNEQQQSGHEEASSESGEQEPAPDTESFESFMEQLLSQNIEEQV
ncbi:flagellar hook-length control protein FliK [Oceanobacillus timonensis]|uniref:flagellar hook-length control protein FliK n=1 Tax=Oceanobacillus timonensis TaxID=1926285 RepID=UPI0009BC5FD0|nr:flagellar hook-length control protein FliK [Oceanobacillus timonensis]